MSAYKKKVAYFYDAEVGNYHYGYGHMMKPLRIRMAHNLMVNYGLFKKMQIVTPHKATHDDMTKFHSDDYIDFLNNVTPDNMMSYAKQLQRFNIGDDCPIFDGMFQYCQISAGGSLGGAVKLNNKDVDIAINWAGGLHHAKKSEASGFCYVNDIVLAILELLKHHQRVLYIDIDVHHGDGVEEAFYTTDRVMSVSFHQFGDFFPGTGDVRDVGVAKGKNYSVNVPLKVGIDDESYQSIFKPVMQAVIDWYRPEAIVLQCGADSLYGDRLGSFNLTEQGHAECLSFLKKFNLPMLLLGGGGYTVKNVARCWVYETAVALDTEIPNELPYNDYLEHYGPEYTLHITPSNMENQNSREYLEKIKNQILQRLRRLPPAPSVAQHEIPPDIMDFSDDEDEEDPDSFSVRDENARIQADNELYDSDEEEEDENIDIENVNVNNNHNLNPEDNVINTNDHATSTRPSIYHTRNGKLDSEMAES